MLAPRKGDRVELVEEEHARCEAARLNEGIVQVRFAHAEVRVEDLFDAHVREREPALAGGRPREQRLAAARRAEQQHAAASGALVPLVEVVALKREDDRALDRLFHILQPAHVGKRDGRLGVQFELWPLRHAFLVDAATANDLDHALQTEALVDLVLQLRDSLDEAE